MQPLRSVERSNFDKGRHNLTTLIQKSTYINESCYIIYVYIYIVKEASNQKLNIGRLIDVVVLSIFLQHHAFINNTLIRILCIDILIFCML